MSECFRKFFIQNSNILKASEFNDELISEGTSLYEVIRIINKVPLFLERHLKRLTNSAEIVNLKLWMNIEEIKENLIKLIKINNVDNGNIKIVFNYKQEGKNTKQNFLAYFIKHNYPSDNQYKEGVSTILFFAERNNPNAKIINTNLRKLSDEKIKENNAYEAILIDRNNNITEGSRSNIFMVKENTVITAPLTDVLGGVTREIIIEICKNEGIEIKEEKINYKEIKNMQALFITGTSPKVLPIKNVEDLYFNSADNKIVKKIINSYNKIINDYIEKNKII
ncbi:branched-chain amino acid aminotransferase [Clostridium sp. USBA 49]|jgi:branched-chain amino acid aminotransferase|uniref:aminotransferase class IV n=1 Tax=Clostridium TaxID=1485 RepID=UPI00099A8E88|nr:MULTISPECIES: aminotransferase class IV [Clostridium]SKA72758.1 branched-chain amino acid aminotransferase [Clostridium sp. USBA 49]